MSFQINRGLFKFDFTDQYAILAVPINAESGEIRKQYLKLVRRLHPDQVKGKTATEQQKATQLLSKMVNPAYKKLSNDKELVEYKLILSTVAKRVIKEASKIEIVSPSAKKLLADTSNIDLAYKKAIEILSNQLYDSIDKSMEIIAEISELNVVYIIKNAGVTISPAKPVATPPPVNNTSTQSPVNNPNQTTNTTNTTEPTPPPKTSEEKTAEKINSSVESYCRRAEEYINKNNYAQAILDLRDALQLDNNNSRIHALLGMAFLYQKQATMAKIHINKAVQINPKDETTIKAKQMLDQATGKPTGKPTATGPKTGPAKVSNKPDDSDGLTIFGIKFGGSKKK
jgi:curved DNA-binding protein CbpA